MERLLIIALILLTWLFFYSYIQVEDETVILSNKLMASELELFKLKREKIKLDNLTEELEENIINLKNDNLELEFRLKGADIQLIDCKQNEPDFLRIARGVANAKYIPDVYDCTEFSHDLKSELIKAGYNVRTVLGYYNYIDGITCSEFDKEKWDCLHSWVCMGNTEEDICFEAVNGELISHSDYEKYYVVK